MKLSLINPWRGPCPPDGFRWTDPEDGWVSHAWDYGTWVDQAKAHLQVNNRPLPDDLEQQMQEQLCKILPPGWCNYESPIAHIQPTMTWDDVKGAILTFTSWIKGGMRFVTQKEADRRALICSRCYLNLPVHGCSACQAAVKEIVGKVSSKYDPFLRACGVCKCLLRAKIHFPIETLDRERKELQEMYPGFCWLKKEGFNYRGSDAD